jgi:hypothetical protein
MFKTVITDIEHLMQETYNKKKKIQVSNHYVGGRQDHVFSNA